MRLQYNIRPYSMRSASFYALATLFAIAAILIPEKTCAEETAVSRFKDYLANPPQLSRILFSEVTCSNTPKRSLLAAAFGENFFYRSLTGYENIDAPVSFTNRNKSLFYTGRSGNTNWTLGGYDLFLSVDPNHEKPDPTVVGVKNKYMILGEILNLGSQHVRPGTFVWSGNRFRAQGNAMAERYGFKEFEGEIFVEGGFVTRMIVQGSGTWGYVYPETPTNIPFGIPQEIIKLSPEGHCVKKKLVITMMTEGVSSNLGSLFDPLQHIDPDITITHVTSNGVEVVQGLDNPLVTQVNLEELRPHALEAKKKQRTTRILISGSLIAIASLIAGILLWKRRL